jgi:hypothetical protein
VLPVVAALVVALGALVVRHDGVSAEPASAVPDSPAPAATTAPYQTMCVRTCDGFYFPLRQNAMPQNFAHDAEACSSACGTGGRLFFFPVSGGGPETMVDLSGHKYADEPKAFAFRKALDPQCTCKPAPWSAAAAAQHQRYAATEAEQRLKFKAERATRAVAEAAKASAEISAAAARDYFDSDPDIRRSPREDERSLASVIPAKQSTETNSERPARPIFRFPDLKSSAW